MSGLTRRDFLRSSGVGVGLGLGAGSVLTGCAGTTTGDIAPKSGRRVVVIGGGWGGATAARYIRMADPSIEVHNCILETELGTTELGLDAQLKEIEQGFFDLLAQRPDNK